MRTLHVSRRMKGPDFPWVFPSQSVWDLPGMLSHEDVTERCSGLVVLLCSEPSVVPGGWERVERRRGSKAEGAQLRGCSLQRAASLGPSPSALAVAALGPVNSGTFIL